MTEESEDYGRPRNVSIGTKITQIAGLSESDTSEWEDNFIDDILRKTLSGRNTRDLTERQIEVIERIWKKHFA